MQFGKVGCPVTSLFTLNQLLKNPLSEFFALKPSTEEAVLQTQTNLDVPFSLYINFLINVDIQINILLSNTLDMLVFVILYSWFLSLNCLQFQYSTNFDPQPNIPMANKITRWF